MIRAISISCLTLGFVLSAIQCLCGMSTPAEVCHVQPAEADCCCAATDDRVTDAPPELPPALAVSGTRFSGTDSSVAPQMVRVVEVLSSRRTLGVAFPSVFSHPAPPLYLMKSALLI